MSTSIILLDQNFKANDADIMEFEPCVSFPPAAAGGRRKMVLDSSFFSICISESLSADKHSVMVPNILLRLSPDGQVLYSCRVTVVAKCPMQLEYFPLDTQKCSLIIEVSLNYLESEFVLSVYCLANLSEKI